jgi:hypothetical protein
MLAPAVALTGGLFVGFFLVAARSPILDEITTRVVHLQLNWAGLPDIVATWLLQIVHVRRFGLLFLLLFLLVIAAKRPRADVVPPLLLLGAGLLSIGILLLALPPDSLQIFLREGTTRYFLQFVGVAWLATGLLADQVRLSPSTSSSQRPTT